MGHGLVPNGQDIGRFAMEHPRQDWLGDDGSARVHRAPLHHVHPTADKRYGAGPNRKLAYGWALRKSILAMTRFALRTEAGSDGLVKIL